MLHIKQNEDNYWNTPMYQYSKRADINLVYKTLKHMPPDFTASQIRIRIIEDYGVTLSTQFIGMALKRFTENQYVVNKKRLKRTWDQSYYTVTNIYVKEFEDN